MRITNTMMSNTMLININRNMSQLNDLYLQEATTKKIMVASDNPILASRALKFRASVAKTQQYQRNAEQGMSWMEITEGAFKNVVEQIKNLKERCVDAANGTLEYTDRQKIVADLKQLMEHIGTEMNQTYAGRYVFSGYRTDHPPVFQQDNNKSYDIRQFFNVEDIEKCKSYQKNNDTQTPVVNDVYILKLPYTGMDGSTVTVNGYTVETRSIDPNAGTPPYNADAYNTTGSPANTVYYIQETGELVIPESEVKNFKDNTEVTYTKTGFKQGDLNPIVYFECRDKDTNKLYDMNNQSIQYEFSVNTKIQINSLSKDVLTDKMYADLRDLIQLVESVETSSEEKLRETLSTANPGISDEELTRLVDEQLKTESQAIQDVLYSRFNNMLKMADKHLSTVSKEYTDMGSRMNRLELIQNRLDQDEESYTKLLSDNEDADLFQVSMLLANAEAVYQASLKAGASVIQMSLANYI